MTFVRMMRTQTVNENNELKDAKTHRRAKGTGRVRLSISVGSSLLMTPFTLHIVIWSIVNKEISISAHLRHHRRSNAVCY